jgi:hypothetical protein
MSVEDEGSTIVQITDEGSAKDVVRELKALRGKKTRMRRIAFATIGFLILIPAIYYVGPWIPLVFLSADERAATIKGTYHGVQIRRAKELMDGINNWGLSLDSGQLEEAYEIKGPDLELAWMENGKLSEWVDLGSSNRRTFLSVHPDIKAFDVSTYIAITELRSANDIEVKASVSNRVSGRDINTKGESSSSYGSLFSFSSHVNFVTDSIGSSRDGRIDDAGNRFVRLYETRAKLYHPVQGASRQTEDFDYYVIWNKQYYKLGSDKPPLQPHSLALVARRVQKSNINSKSDTAP